ncbi:MAG: hypothetical protein L7F77_12205 [Candidatus Magnetominusculus sp. LBB02]|nr:hypothetical protein [Candidatus Magnetominusculus sp. LBB02]
MIRVNLQERIAAAIGQYDNDSATDLPDKDNETPPKIKIQQEAADERRK